LEAQKHLERVDLSTTPSGRVPPAIAEAVHRRHRAASRSIVVLNRVELAQQVYAALLKRVKSDTNPPRVALLHSRFRPADRAARMVEALADPVGAGTIVVATQVIEAGVDLSSALLATETAPFSSIVQRLGRCNRAGKDAGAIALWLDRGDLDDRAAAPYHPQDLTAARAALEQLEGHSVSPATLESAMPVAERRETSAVLRRRDLIDLFDTAPDLSGTHVDVAPYIRADDERSVSVFFRALGPLASAEIERQPAAGRDELVGVPIASVKDMPAWSFDIVDRCWRRMAGNERARPGTTLMLDAEGGGYDAMLGWTGRPSDIATPLPAPDVEPEGIGSDPGSRGREFVRLVDHLDDAMTAAREITGALHLSPALAACVERAAALHDVGKAHPVFQAMLLSAAPPQERDAVRSSVWAKSVHPGGKHVRPHFRHELASALVLNGASLSHAAPEDDLVRYLVAAHHGRVRLSIRPAPEEEAPKGAAAGTRFALGVVEGDVVAAVMTPVGEVRESVLDLVEMELGGGGARSWVALSCALRDAHGPFVLAYLEALVRIADWRASG
jgi:CRISPR-associated endonuclease/helicase Cas3